MFYGSQIQKHFNTVQQELQKKLNILFKDVTTIQLSGRTDRHVHATYQVANFNSANFIEKNKLIAFFKKNYSGISIHDVQMVSKSFHARRSASLREYNYKFTLDEIPNYLHNYLSSYGNTFNINQFQSCLNMIIGKHDFVAFANRGSNHLTTERTLFYAKITKYEYKLLTDPKKTIIIYNVCIRGNAFLYRMIRNIIGSIFQILDPKNSLKESDFQNLVINKSRSFNFKPANPNGLYLTKVNY